MYDLWKTTLEDLRAIPGQEPYMGDDNANLLLTRGYGYTCRVDGGTPICAAGAVFLWQGVAELWAVMGTQAHDHKLYIIRSMRRILAEIVRIKELQRVQAYVRAHEPSHVKLMKAVGLYEEAFIEAYFPNHQNALLFGKVYR